VFALIPQASKWVDGVVELRGKVIPVIDLRAFFDLKSEGDQQKRTIVVDIRGKVMGINVDAVEGIIQKAKNEINLAPEAAFVSPAPGKSKNKEPDLLPLFQLGL